MGLSTTSSLSARRSRAWHGLGLLAASLAIYAWPMAGIAAFGLFLRR